MGGGPPSFLSRSATCATAATLASYGPNNAIEGFHQGFAVSMVCAGRPNMWRLLTALKRQQALTRLDVAGVLVGAEKKPGRAQRERSDRILPLTAKNTSGGNDVPKTLREIAYNYM